MLTLDSGSAYRDCSGVSRRDFIRVGALGMGALSMPTWLAARAAAGSTGEDFVRDKAVVILYLSGGASHIETFNPNMDAPAPYHSLTGEVKTSLPGVTFGGTYPMLAQHADKMAIVRSFRHSVGDHGGAHVHVLTGGTNTAGKGEEGHSIGSLYARLRGANNPVTGMPTYALLTHAEEDGQYSKELGRIRDGSAPRMLGPTFSPFEHVGGEEKDDRRSRSRGGDKGGGVSADMKLSIEPGRLSDRRELLQQLDRLRGEMDQTGRIDAMSKYQQQAFELITGSASKAFSVKDEDPRIIDRYDTSGMKIGHKKFRPSTLGTQMLMARRLCEAGAEFVTVHSAGWDMHADGNNPGMVKGMNMLGTTMDKAVSAFIEDCESRGMSDKILLVITGDFGRTPKVNKNGGRDHWASLGTLAFAGGGLKMGQVIGQADRQNGAPATEPVTPQMMMGTILQTLFDVGQLRVARGVPRDLLKIVEESAPIAELM